LPHSTEAVGFSHGDFGFVVEALDNTAGKQFLSPEVIEDNETQAPNDDRIEAMIAQTRAWIERSGSFDILGRYESRLTRKVLQFTRELEHLQKDRKHQESIDELHERIENRRDRSNMASSCETVPELEMQA
jgi:hypothetical protein